MHTCTREVYREAVTFESEGKKIFGVLHLPEKGEKCPVVVILHGFASHKVGTNRSYVNMGEMLAKEGAAVFRFDFRGSGDSEGDPLDVSISTLVADALKALHFVENDSRLDNEKIGLFGSSLGGSIAVLAASRFNKIKSLMLWAPVASGKLWYQDFITQNPNANSSDPSSLFGSHRGVKVGMQFRDEFAIMDAAKALNTLENIPLLHLHGEKDPYISLLHQKAFEEQRKGAKAASRFLSFPDHEHMLGRSLFFPQVLKETTSWVQSYLL